MMVHYCLFEGKNSVEELVEKLSVFELLNEINDLYRKGIEIYLLTYLCIVSKERKIEYIIIRNNK